MPLGAAFLGASPGRVTSEEAGAHRLRCAAEPRGLLSKMALSPPELAFSYSRFSLVGYALRRGALSWSCSTATPASARVGTRDCQLLYLCPQDAGGAPKRWSPEPVAASYKKERGLEPRQRSQASVPGLLGSRGKPPPCPAGDLGQVGESFLQRIGILPT